MPNELLVGEVMTKSPHTIGLQLSLADASKVMRKFKIRHLPVLDGGSLVGVLSERDVQVISSVSQLDPSCILVEDAMSGVPWTVSPDTPVRTVARVMANKKLGSAVVVQREKVIGVFTTTDGMRALADTLEDAPKKKGSGGAA